MVIDPSIFKGYDIRAIYPTQLDEEGIAVVTKAIYKFFVGKISEEKQLRILLSYDMRLSGPKLYPVVRQTLIDLGADVTDIGMSSTPTFYFAVNHYGYDCGIQVTASHNPPEYNGLKFVINTLDGLMKIGKSTGMDEIKELSLNGNITYDPKFEGKMQDKSGVLDDEVDNALKITGNPKINNFKIVADPANAMGATYIEALEKKVPMDLVKMNFNLDGSFPSHQPDPLKYENLVDLQKKVLAEKADLGLAPDGDGDRLFFIDEKGQIVPPTIITSIVAREMLKKNPDAMILFDIRYIFTPVKIVEENHGKWGITKVGHANITESMTKAGAVFGGESSAHFFFKDAGNGEAPLPVVLYILSVMTRERKKMSELVEELRRSYESGEFNFKVTNAEEIREALKQKYSDGQLNDLDGIAISYPTWRFSVRSSNTEPLMRLNVEAYDQKTMEEKRDELKHAIQSLAKLA